MVNISKAFAGVVQAIKSVVYAPFRLAQASYRTLRSVDGIDETAYAFSQTLPGLAGPASGAAVFLGGILPVGAGAAGSVAEYCESLTETSRLAKERKDAEMLARSAEDALARVTHNANADLKQAPGALLTEAGHQWRNGDSEKKASLIGLMNNVALKQGAKEELTAQHKEMRTRKRFHWTGPAAMLGMTAAMVPGAMNYVMQSAAAAKHVAAPAVAVTAGTAASSIFLGAQVFMTAYGALRAAQGRKQVERLDETLSVVQGSVGQSIRSAHPENEALQQGMTLAEEDLSRKITYARTLGMEYGTATGIGQVCMAAGTVAGFGGVTMPLGAAMFIPGMALTVGAAASRACWEAAEKRYLGRESEAENDAPATEESMTAERLAGKAAEEAARSAEGIVQAKINSLFVKADRRAGKKHNKAQAVTPEAMETLSAELERESETLTPRTRRTICLPFIGRNTTLLPSMRQKVKEEVSVMARSLTSNGTAEKPAYGDRIRRMTGASELENPAQAALQYARQAGEQGGKRWRQAFREEFGRKTRRSDAFRHAMNAVKADTEGPITGNAADAFLQSSEDAKRYRAERAMTQATARIAKDQAKAAFQTYTGKLTSALKAERKVRLAMPLAR